MGATERQLGSVNQLDNEAAGGFGTEDVRVMQCGWSNVEIPLGDLELLTINPFAEAPRQHHHERSSRVLVWRQPGPGRKTGIDRQHTTHFDLACRVAADAGVKHEVPSLGCAR